jgi:DNA polymerase-3 subunit chi
MARIGFYHLTRTGPEAALPRLLGRALADGGRAMVLSPEAERIAALDASLWTSADPDWLPHGTPASGHAPWQPIWLTTEAGQAPNGARFLFLLDGADGAALDAFERVFDLFDGGNEDAVAAARRRWAAAKAAGHDLTYWKQTATGWEKAA